MMNSIRLILLIGLLLPGACGYSQNKKPLVGVYYFNGWQEATKWHVTASLKDNFSDREPEWGWYKNDIKEVMSKEISLADNAGIDFFSFCWYFPENWEKNYWEHPLNLALLYFRELKPQTFKYNLMVANHAGLDLGPEDWERVTQDWVKMFKEEAYLKVEGKPFISFFSLDELVKRFGSTEALKQALSSFRSKVKAAGFSDVCIGINLEASSRHVRLAEQLGFDEICGYNYHNAGFKGNEKSADIAKLSKGEIGIWNYFLKQSRLNVIPTVTLNWDPRPWISMNNALSESAIYAGYSPKSISQSIGEALKWLGNGSSRSRKTQVLMLYAWNEYGEGAYLTPNKEGNQKLNAVKRALGR
jgi:hypothetical protein